MEGCPPRCRQPNRRGAVSTASRRSMPAGSRRSEPAALLPPRQVHHDAISGGNQIGGRDHDFLAPDVGARPEDLFFHEVFVKEGPDGVLLPGERGGGLFAAVPPTKSAGRGFDRLSAVDAGWKPALRAGSFYSRLVRFTTMPSAARTRSAGVIMISSPQTPAPTPRTSSSMRSSSIKVRTPSCCQEKGGMEPMR